MNLGIAGAGTMAAELAAAARAAGLDVRVCDAGTELAALAPCEIVIETAPEALDAKRALLAALAHVVAPGAVLATTSASLPVSAIAAGVPGPERVVGLHFAAPAALAELVAGPDSSDAALARARALAEALGKRVIRAADGPGFLVTRCTRPYALEAQRIVQERLATPAQVDRICRRALGFPLGPFELADRVGVEAEYAVTRSLYDQTLEPRWRPSALAGQLAASGRGWYVDPPADPEPPAPGGGDGLVVIAGESALADALLAAAVDAGWDAAAPAEAEGELPFLIVDCGATEEDPPLQGGPQVLLCDTLPLAAHDPGGTAAGFFLPTPLLDTGLVELASTPTTAPAAAAAAERFFATLGLRSEWVGDAPGLVSGRMLTALVNEACFALGEGVASAAEIDRAVALALEHPRGPLGWGDLLGPELVLGMLGGLWDEYREERYRPAPALLAAVRAELELDDANLNVS